MADGDIEVDASRINLRLERLQPQVHDALVVAVTLDAGEVEGAAKSNASGALLQVRSGKFVRSIKSSVRQSANKVTGRVYSNDPRAKLFEFGGKTGPHDILPENTRALLLSMRSGDVFASRVHHPGGTYAPREIIHSAFDGMAGNIKSDLAAAVSGAIPK